MQFDDFLLLGILGRLVCSAAGVRRMRSSGLP